ncbi:dehydrogenase/reductase SDR family member 11-like [Planococcus citri]|uniref:dehydrogenase/reductase SDR family member 11-like n=1 Tax=Planococcus citri TaxID=170843 RepID=UPI0031FA1547
MRYYYGRVYVVIFLGQLVKKFTMDRWLGKYALVTGANSALSQAIIQRLLDAGINVVAVDKSEPVKKLSGAGQFHFKAYDLSKEDDVWNIFIWIEENFGGVDILINNADFALNQTLLDGESKGWSDVVNTNIMSYIISTKEFLRGNADRDLEVGHIVNISNLYGYRNPVNSGLNFYAATQHAITHYNRHLRIELELRDSPVKVTCISPCIDPYKDDLNQIDLKDTADAVFYALDTPYHLQVYEVMLESFDTYE